jgi:hypothetical protein
VTEGEAWKERSLSLEKELEELKEKLESEQIGTTLYNWLLPLYLFFVFLWVELLKLRGLSANTVGASQHTNSAENTQASEKKKSKKKTASQKHKQDHETSLSRLDETQTLSTLRTAIPALGHSATLSRYLHAYFRIQTAIFLAYLAIEIIF